MGHKEQDIAWALIMRPNQKFLNSIEDILLFLNGYNVNGTYDEKKLKWCLINGYLHFYLMNKNDDYRKAIRELLEKILKISFK